ncbi:MAG: radical SAM family heme chaperone HemW [Chloroflexota bacterium]|nr:radical SAM family heme chaperone HemW [Chloroflexota bacterium]MDE2946319.1 radical SAM family heme chaperone HemW [Chloroflexota bacterium]
MPYKQSALSIYIHVPFCSVRCSYCAFNTYTDLEHLIPAYVDALCRELKWLASRAADRRIHTVYFGGGTPSRLSPAQFEQVLRQLHDSYSIDDDAEISLEANPDDLSENYFRRLKCIGFNRVSIGMQSANAAILRIFERQHDLGAVENALRHARRAGFDNINLDVIFGSPAETLADWKKTVDTTLRFAPEHVSMYGLELKGGTRLRHQVDAGELPRPDDDDFADMYEHASERLAAAGYEQYEISSWGQPGHQCRHNLQYWRNLEYIGVGAGAHGFADGYRYSTITAPERYIAALSGDLPQGSSAKLTPAVAKAERVDEAQELYETIMMGLRMTREGINRAGFKQRFGRDFVEMFPEATERMKAAALLRVTFERVCLSQSGRLLSNTVIREFVDRIKI